MTVFPSLIPSTRTFSPGEYPHTAYNSFGRTQTRVRHSNVMLASTLRLSFVAITEAQMLEILDHYHGHRGNFDPFTLPVEVWSAADQAEYELTDYQWNYASKPQIDDRPCRPDGGHIFTVSVELESAVPVPDNA